ncbi:MAG TPA: hypothetical protein VH590_04885, partial [Ktedonobacterales bacterium]
FCMFGHHESAQATVLLAEDVSGSWEDAHHIKLEFVLEVHPPNGQAFRAKATHHFIRFTPYPQVGDVVYVKYDPKSLEVKLDVNDDNRYGEKGLKRERDVKREAEQARRDALLAEPPAAPLSLAALASSPLLKGINPADLNPELLEMVRQAEAERLAAQQPGAPGQPQAAPGLAEAQALHRELEYGGSSGQAKILRKQQTGEPVHHHAPFFVEALVQPDNLTSPFQCAFTTWIDSSRGTLTEGHTHPVRYDPQNTARVVFAFSA